MKIKIKLLKENNNILLKESTILLDINNNKYVIGNDDDFYRINYNIHVARDVKISSNIRHIYLYVVKFKKEIALINYRFNFSIKDVEHKILVK